MTAAALVKRVKVETEQLGAELLGDGHRRVLKDLVSLLSSLQTGDTQSPRVVVLEGASGSGKSRIVRELYRRLRAGEPSPGYWPELPEEWSVTKAGVDPIPNRKRLGPPIDGFIWNSDTLPSFTWWVFNCDRMQHGDVVDVVSQVAPELRVASSTSDSGLATGGQLGRQDKGPRRSGRAKGPGGARRGWTRCRERSSGSPQRCHPRPGTGRDLAAQGWSCRAAPAPTRPHVSDQP